METLNMSTWVTWNWLIHPTKRATAAIVIKKEREVTVEAEDHITIETETVVAEAERKALLEEIETEVEIGVEIERTLLKEVRPQRTCCRRC
jgi:CRISPR/Cas system CMR subunit Cmr4 (Cas7 group RAMP superfamily)